MSSYLTGLIEYISLNEASGTRRGLHADKTWAEDGGTINSGAGQVYSTAADFEADDLNRLQRTDTDLDLGDTDFTVAAWFNLESLPADNQAGVVVDKTSAGAFEWRFSTFTEGGGTKILLGVHGGGSFPFAFIGGLTTSTWYFGIGWHDAGSNLIWVQLNNGTPASADSLGPIQVGTSAMSIGNSYEMAANRAFDGRIGSVMYWNRILTAGERERLWNGGRGLTYPDMCSLKTRLVELWPLDESSGSRAGAHAGKTLTDNNTVASDTGLVYALAADFEAANANESLTRSSDVDLNCAGDADFTFAFWFKAETLPGDGVFMNLIEKGISTFPDMEFRIFIAGSGGNQFLSFGLREGAGIPSCASPDDLSTGVWYLGLCWHDAAGNIVAAQINEGTPGTTAITTPSAGNTAWPLRLGARDTGSGLDIFYDGLLGPVMFWRRLLSARERSLIYNGGAGRSYAHLQRIFGLARV